MALYRLICSLGQHSLVTVLLKCHLPLPVYFLADEKHSRCLTDRVYLPTIVSGRVMWHLGYSASKSAVAFTESYGQFQRVASQEDPSYEVQGVLIDGFDSTTSSMRTLFPGARLGNCLRHALNKLPDKLIGGGRSIGIWAMGGRMPRRIVWRGPRFERGQRVDRVRSVGGWF